MNVEEIIETMSDAELLELNIGCENHFEQGYGRCKYNRGQHCLKGAVLTSTLLWAHPNDCPLRAEADSERRQHEAD